MPHGHEFFLGFQTIRQSYYCLTVDKFESISHSTNFLFQYSDRVFNTLRVVDLIRLEHNSSGNKVEANLGLP